MFSGPHRDRNYAAIGLVWETGCTVDQLIALRCDDLSDHSIFVGNRLVRLAADLPTRLSILARDCAGHEHLLRGVRTPALAEKVLRRALSAAAECAGIADVRLSGIRRAHAVHRFELGERVKDIAADIGMAEFSTYRSLRGLPTGADGESYHS